MAESPEGNEREQGEDLREALRLVREERDRAVHDVVRLRTKLGEVNGYLDLADQVKSRFFANMRRQIHPPIARLLSLSMDLIQSPEGPIDPAPWKQTALRMRRHLLDLHFDMRDILAAAELESGDLSLVPTCIETGPFMLVCLEVLAHRIADKGVQVRLPAVMPHTLSQDADRMHLIVTNLLRNAIESSPTSGIVLIDLIVRDGMIRFSAEDEGEGFPPEVLPHIFNPYFLSPQASTVSRCGTGLGLSVVQSLVILMGGTMTVKSDIKRGTRFDLQVPELSSSFLENELIHAEMTNRADEQEMF